LTVPHRCDTIASVDTTRIQELTEAYHASDWRSVVVEQVEATRWIESAVVDVDVVHVKGCVVASVIHEVFGVSQA